MSPSVGPLALAVQFRHFRRTPGSLGKLRRYLRGLGRRTPAWRLASVAPGPWPIEGVYPEFVHFLHFADPGRAHPISMIVGRFANLGQPDLPVEHRIGDFLGTVPHIGLADDVGNVVAGKGELAGVMAVLVLIDHTANGRRIEARESAIEHDLRHRDLTAHGFAARFEVDRFSETFFGPGARLLIE